MLLSSAQTSLPSLVPLFMTLSFVIPPSSPPFQHERLRSSSVRIKLSSADGENINQVMHIRQTSVREEGRNMFTRFLLIVLSMFPRLFRHPVFIHHSTTEDVLECPLSAQGRFSCLSLSQNLSRILLPVVCSNIHHSLYFQTWYRVQVWNDMKVNKWRISCKL